MRNKPKVLKINLEYAHALITRSSIKAKTKALKVTFYLFL